MKPSGHLTRTAPLRRHTRLVGDPKTAQKWRDRSQRNAAARRCPKSSTPVSVPKKPRKKTGSGAGESKARKLVYARSGGLCEVRIPGICLGPGMNWHHLLDRKHGGRWAASNGVHVCGSGSPGHGCHGTLTTPPPGRAGEFEANGWILPSTAVPGAVPVLMAALYGEVLEIPVLVLLTDDGQYREVG